MLRCAVVSIEDGRDADENGPAQLPYRRGYLVNHQGWKNVNGSHRLTDPSVGE